MSQSPIKDIVVFERESEVYTNTCARAYEAMGGRERQVHIAERALLEKELVSSANVAAAVQKIHI